MNRLILGGIAAVVAAAGGGGVWWMSQQREAAAPIAAESKALAAGGAAQAAVVQTPAPESIDAAPAPEPIGETPPIVAAASQAESVAIERGSCFGPCPIYKATLYGDERLVFEGRKFVARDGVHERRMAVGSFARVVAVATRHDFASMDSNWPDDKGLNCPEPPTDMPTVTIALATAEIRHSVAFYEGCAGSAGADRVAALVKDLDAAFDLDAWIGPRDAWYGQRTKP